MAGHHLLAAIGDLQALIAFGFVWCQAAKRRKLAAPGATGSKVMRLNTAMHYLTENSRFAGDRPVLHVLSAHRHQDTGSPEKAPMESETFPGFWTHPCRSCRICSKARRNI